MRMDRRNVLGALGATAAGLAAGSLLPSAAAAEAHDANPVNQFHAYLCAFHIAKKDPKFLVEAHHYCSMLREGVHQCVIFDSAGKGARILGVEYIISDKLYQGLPDAEKKYYHPHTYEVISGLLLAPDMPKDAEKEFMADLVTTWGKAWHTWPDPNTPLPMGEPLLMWAATRDGMIPEDALGGRDKRLKVSTAAIRKRRAYLGPVPQVDPPKSVDDIGRQWTNEGPDEPKRD
ncbi:MAG TPA: DUF1264 domain-containing protein [Planctomycetales bacterium]|jgi:hypothetical protein|nr:DUF1264 domain-containing protein [Planctomycetales bacterium]